MSARAGRFITFEGIDGSGKTTQLRLLAERLRDAGREVVTTREPGGSPGAEQIRRILIEGEPGRWSPESELLLFTAARRDHIERLIDPALSAGKVVLCDRFADSTRVYQGLRGAELRAQAEALHAAFIGREPDLTVLIDIPAEAALARAEARGDAETRFESMGLDFHQRLRTGFLDLASAAPARFVVIDGARPAAEVAHDVAAACAARVP